MKSAGFRISGLELFSVYSFLREARQLLLRSETDTHV
jgi:hypothetical protein